MRLALGVREPDDQHVLGKPALLARLPARDAQGVTFLAEQCVATVAGAEALDAELFGEMHDEASRRIELADGMQAAHELAFAGDALQRRAPAARHDRHIEHDVGAVGDFHSAARVGRIDRAHAIGDDVQRALAHAAAEKRTHFRVRLGRCHPVIIGSGIRPWNACR